MELWRRSPQRLSDARLESILICDCDRMTSGRHMQDGSVSLVVTRRQIERRASGNQRPFTNVPNLEISIRLKHHRTGPGGCKWQSLPDARSASEEVEANRIEESQLPRIPGEIDPGVIPR